MLARKVGLVQTYDVSKGPRLDAKTRYMRITYNPMTALQALVPRSGLDHAEALVLAEV